MKPTEKEIHMLALYMRVDQIPMTAYKKGVKFGIDYKDNQIKKLFELTQQKLDYTTKQIPKLETKEERLIARGLKAALTEFTEELNNILK
jgi:hypothetical protein